jgi:hypothetical protein
MNFCSAHRSRALFYHHRRRVCAAYAALWAIIIASPCLADCGRPAGRVEAFAVDERLDIELNDGRIVRLGGAGWTRPTPNAARAKSRMRRVSS